MYHNILFQTGFQSCFWVRWAQWIPDQSKKNTVVRVRHRGGLVIESLSCRTLYHKNKIHQVPKKWKNVDFLIKREPIKKKKKKRISPTVNWCKNAGSLCRWVFCPGRYTFVGDKSKSLNWKIRLKSFASSIIEDFACYFLLLSHFQEPIEWWNEQSDIDSFLI